MAPYRVVIGALAWFAAVIAISSWQVALYASADAADNYRGSNSEVERWMTKWIDDQKALTGALRVGRFRDPMYFLLSPINWTPNLNEPQTLQPVTVPTGFVTDFASIPRIFWSALRPDGEYAYAAVVHDYLYWTQTRPRDEADEILKLAMQDLKVSGGTITAIYEAVHVFGGGAWNENKNLKQSGERRILKAFPDDPAILWSEYKQRPDVFERGQNP
jgi:hypothetical protein